MNNRRLCISHNIPTPRAQNTQFSGHRYRSSSRSCETAGLCAAQSSKNPSISSFQRSQPSGNVSRRRALGELAMQQKSKIWPKNLKRRKVSQTRPNTQIDIVICEGKCRRDNYNSLRTKSKLNRNTALHFPEDALSNRPVHCILETASHLHEVFICQKMRDSESFVQIRSTDVEARDHVSAFKHGVCYCYCWGEGVVRICLSWSWGREVHWRCY